jgi:hypothetical protein
MHHRNIQHQGIQERSVCLPAPALQLLPGCGHLPPHSRAQPMVHVWPMALVTQESRLPPGQLSILHQASCFTIAITIIKVGPVAHPFQMYDTVQAMLCSH